MYGEHWDRDFEKRLLAQFELPLGTPLKTLSRGQRMKAALLSSLAYRPQLVVLDEPFSGLDALVRDEFLTGLLELTENEGWTVWISSHDIEEVERFADRVAILNAGRSRARRGRRVAAGALPRGGSGARERSRRPAGDAPGSWINLQPAGRTVRYVDSNFDESGSSSRSASHFPDALRHEARPMSLREIFVALARTYRLDNGSSAAA